LWGQTLLPPPPPCQSVAPKFKLWSTIRPPRDQICASMWLRRGSSGPRDGRSGGSSSRGRFAWSTASYEERKRLVRSTATKKHANRMWTNQNHTSSPSLRAYPYGGVWIPPCVVDLDHPPPTRDGAQRSHSQTRQRSRGSSSPRISTTTPLSIAHNMS
jgi:hypothetical protein